MNETKWLKEIADKAVDVERYAQYGIVEAAFREWVVDKMVNHPEIMVYYHSFYIVSRATTYAPECFYAYWEVFEKLLEHPNSYHRDFGLTLIANLIPVDHERRFEKIEGAYLSRIDDEKFMTAECCVANLKKIVGVDAVYCQRIVSFLLEKDSETRHSERQKALLDGKMIEVFEQGYSQLTDKAAIDRFVNRCQNSLSPQTRKRAKAFKKKWQHEVAVTRVARAITEPERS